VSVEEEGADGRGGARVVSGLSRARSGCIAGAEECAFYEPREINDESLGPTEWYGRTKLAMILLAKYGLAGRVILEIEVDIMAHDADSTRATRRYNSSRRTRTPVLRANFSPRPC
jgi:hypothetical protein